MEVGRTSQSLGAVRDPAAARPAERPPTPPAVPLSLWDGYRAAEEDLLDLPTYETLRRYKRAVQELLKRALASKRPVMDMHVSRHGFKRLVYVHAVEQSLDEITPDRLREWQGVKLLQRLDLIRGLLLDLFL